MSSNSPGEESPSLATTLLWPPARPHRDRIQAAELPRVLRATRLQLGVVPAGLFSVQREVCEVIIMFDFRQCIGHVPLRRESLLIGGTSTSYDHGMFV